MATYNGTSIVGTPGASGTSSVAEDAMQATTSSSGNGLTVTNTGTAYGISSQSSGGALAPLLAQHSNAGGTAVIATNTAASGGSTGNGIKATTSQSGGTGVHGINNSSANGGVGVYGQADINTGTGVQGTTNGSTGIAVLGTATGGGTAYGVYGQSSGASGIGVSGISASATGYGVFAENTASLTTGTGLYAKGYEYCIYADAPSGSGGAVYSLYANGQGEFIGLLTKSGGGFKIDHPNDPANQHLFHSFVESPDMKNVYDGVATADGSGEAVVTLPGYFEALNSDFRYQLTALGAAAPDLHVKDELKSCRFVIAGARSGQRVSWQVTGIRRDAWANANRIVPEVAKSAEQKGLYRHPELHGKGAEMGIDFRKQKNADAIRAAANGRGLL